MAATIEAPEKLVGKPIRRREDPKLMTGGGNFLDDIRLPGMSYAAVLRSPVAHAKIRGIDTSRANASAAATLNASTASIAKRAGTRNPSLKPGSNISHE